MGVNIIETTGEETVQTIHERSDRSSQKTIFTEDGVQDIIVPRFIYLKLGNVVDAKVCSEELHEDEENEYDAFMMAMNRYNETGINIENIAELDAYLGKLGGELVYPFEDDTYDGPVIGAGTGLFSRNVVYNDGTEVINVIYDNNGTIENVTHDVTYES